MKVDWIIHFIPCGSRPSFHTHGLDRHGSLELELNLPLNPKQAMQFINLIAMDLVEQGKQYHSGDRNDDVFNLPLYFYQTKPTHPPKGTCRSDHRTGRAAPDRPAGSAGWAWSDRNTTAG